MLSRGLGTSSSCTPPGPGGEALMSCRLRPLILGRLSTLAAGQTKMLFLALLALLPALSLAEDEVTDTAEIRSLHVVSDIRFRFARTVVTSRVANPSASSADMVFHVTLPNTAFITDFRFYSLSAKRMYYGRIEERETAQRRYTVAKEKGEPVGYIGESVTETNTFKVVLNVRPADKVTFNLTYEEVLQRQQGLYKHDIFIDPGQPVPDMKIDVAVQDSRDIITLKTPLKTGNVITDVDISGKSSMLVVQRPSPKSAYIRFHPTLDEQMARWAEGISGLFTVEYDVDRGFDAGDVLVSNGYFIHFFAPAVTNPVPKDVLFILDTSTSMFKGKLDQLKAAMTVILNDLNPDDRFNIISFGSRVVFWQKDMAEVKQKANVQRAIDYLDNLTALGWTNVKKSIEKGMKYLTDNSRSAEGSLVIYLTDGHATAGETNPKAILKILREANTKDIPLYTLAFGKDADWELMKKMAIQNYGIARRIYTDGNAAKQIEDFYNTVSNALLQGVTFQYSNAVSKSTQSKFPSYTQGSELVVTGQVDPTTKDLDSLVTNVIATSSSGGVTLKPSSVVVDLKTEFQNLTNLYNEYNIERMTKKMWAYLYIKEILKKRIGETDESKREELAQEALRLSLEHRFVTSVTSMIVDAPYEEKLGDYIEDEDLYYLKENILTTPAPYVTRRRYYGGGGGGGGWSSGGGGGDPHFMVFMKGLKYPICFDMPGEDHQMYQFVQDTQTGLTVNMKIGKGKKHRHDGGFRMYMVEFAVILYDLHILVTRSNVNIHGINYPWDTDYNGTIPGAQFFIARNSSRLSRLSIVFDSRIRVDITNHVHKDTDPLGGNYLNIEMGNAELLSDDTDGILGQFIHKKIRLNNITFKNGRLLGHLRTRTGEEVDHGRARIVHRRDPVWREKVSCWMLRNMGKRLYTQAEDYIVTDMFQTTLA